MKSKRSRLIKQCDTLLAKILKIRRGFQCEYTPGHKIKKMIKLRGLHAHHIFKKGHYINVRWDEDNILILCYHCHRFIAHASDVETLQGFERWVKQHLGGRYTKLKQRAVKIRPVKTHMLEALKKELELELEEELEKQIVIGETGI